MARLVIKNSEGKEPLQWTEKEIKSALRRNNTSRIAFGVFDGVLITATLGYVAAMAIAPPLIATSIFGGIGFGAAIGGVSGHVSTLNIERDMLKDALRDKRAGITERPDPFFGAITRFGERPGQPSN